MEPLKALPEPGTLERTDLDFKVRFNVDDPIEMAKDVAAFANGLGGTLLIGARGDSAKLVEYPGLSPESAAGIPRAYEEAVRDRCRPPPRLTFRTWPLPDSDQLVVAVEVAMSPVAPVGVSVRQGGGGKLVDKAWVFPVRTNSQTTFLLPDQFGTFEDVNTRQAAAALASITDADRDHIVLRSRHLGASGARPRLNARLVAVKLEKNVAEFMAGEHEADGLKPLSVPLSWIETVWRDDRSNVWMVHIAPEVLASSDGFKLTPPAPKNG